MLTELEGVNRLLDAIGEDAVSAVNPDDPDSSEAQRFLLRVSKDVQEAGWSFNRETGQEFTPDNSGYIYLPKNTLRADPTDKSKRYVIRELNGRQALYNVRDRSFKITVSKISLEIVYLFGFEELPLAAANYISWEAAGQFQMSEYGSTTVDASIERSRRQAWIRFQDAEADVDDANLLFNNYQVYRGSRRKHRSYTR